MKVGMREKPRTHILVMLGLWILCWACSFHGERVQLICGPVLLSAAGHLIIFLLWVNCMFDTFCIKESDAVGHLLTAIMKFYSNSDW